MLFFILLAFIIATGILIKATFSNLKKQSIAPNKVVIKKWLYCYGVV